MGIADYGGDVDFQYLSGIAIPRTVEGYFSVLLFPPAFELCRSKWVKIRDDSYGSENSRFFLGSANVDKSQRFYNGDKDIKADDE